MVARMCLARPGGHTITTEWGKRQGGDEPITQFGP
jgi:hypothetical protein